MGSLHVGSVVTWVWVWVLNFRASFHFDGLRGRRLRCHVEGVANSLLGLLGEGSASTFDGSVVTRKGF